MSITSYSASLPFMNKGVTYDLVLKDADSTKSNEHLKDLINDGIKRQREENVTLKQYSDPEKISRFEQDIIRRILKSQGYYRYFVNAQIIKKIQDTDKPKPSLESNSEVEKIIYFVTPGTQYKVSNIQFNIDTQISIEKIPKLIIQQGSSLIAENILSSLDQLRKYIRHNFCFYDVNIDYKVIIDHQTNSASLTFKMAPSQQTQFGPIFINGLQTIEYDYLMSFITYKEGQCFNREKIDAARLSLFSSNLVSNVDINVGEIENNQVVTIFKVDERNHRTVKAGIGYSTDEGAYLTAGWEHRNFIGDGEKLDINTRVSSIRQQIFSELFIPKFFKHNKTLTLYSEAQNEELDSYNALSLKAGAKIGFKYTDFLNYSIGSELKISDVNDAGNKESFYLLSFPVEIEWDHTNNILDPTAGFLMTAEVRPYIDVIHTETKFYKTMLSMSGYQTFDIALQPTFAARYSVGAITGESVENIPADERFYVGGGGSVRGYPYQSLSKLNGDDPEGGASFQQINTELRIRFLENWGLATFVGGGFAFDEATPNLNQELLWGAGLGLRYYTSFAPFRMDIAFPLNKREGYDNNFQLYISIGQAF